MSDSFRDVEQRIALTRKRLRGYPQQQVMLARLITHVQKRQTELCNAALKVHELNMVTYMALMMLYGSPEQTLTPSELSQATGEKPTNVTRVCDELLARGLIERSAGIEDRRKVVLRLSAAGEALVRQLQPGIWQSLEQLYGSFDEDQTQTLTSLLRQVLARLDQAGP
jgi:MarR family transcriptional repressor of emrRAB